MATFDSRMESPQPHQPPQHYRASSTGAGTAPIPIPQSNRNYRSGSQVAGLRVDEGYLPQPLPQPQPASYGSYPPPQHAQPQGSYPSSQPPYPQPAPYGSYPPPQHAQPQGSYPSSQPPYPQPGSYQAYAPPVPNGVSPAMMPVPPQAQPQYPPSSYPRRPRGHSQQSSYSNRSDASPARGLEFVGAPPQHWLPTTYEQGYPGPQGGRPSDRRSSYDHTPHQGLSEMDAQRRGRRASYSTSRRDRESRRNDEYADSSDSRRSSSSERARARRRKERRHRKHLQEDKRVTIGDSTLFAWETIKGAVTGKR